MRDRAFVGILCTVLWSIVLRDFSAYLPMPKFALHDKATYYKKASTMLGAGLRPTGNMMYNITRTPVERSFCLRPTTEGRKQPKAPAARISKDSNLYGSTDYSATCLWLAEPASQPHLQAYNTTTTTRSPAHPPAAFDASKPYYNRLSMSPLSARGQSNPWLLSLLTATVSQRHMLHSHACTFKPPGLLIPQERISNR